MKIKYKKLALIFVVLSLFLTIASVSANDVNLTDEGLILKDVDLENTDAEPVDDGASNQDAEPIKNATFTKISNKNYVKGTTFNVKLNDDNGTGLANKSVQFTINGKASNFSTNDLGIAKLPLTVSKGTYTVKYMFNENGYNPISASLKILVITTTTSKFKASPYTAYVGVKNTYAVTLTVDGMALSGRDVTFKIANKKTTVKTDSKGQAKININLKKGTYYIYYSYAGEKNIKKASGKAKITVKKEVPTHFEKVNSIIYRHKTSSPFKIKLVDVRGSALANKKVIFALNNKKYVKKTNKNGIVSIDIKLSKGTYKLKVHSIKTVKHNKASKTYSIVVKPKQARNNGLWLLSTDMAKVNFKTLQKYGTKHIFLNAKAIERYNKSYVEDFIAEASVHKIKVHLWMQVFYNSGKWQNPVKKGKIDYDLINSKVKLAKSYANVKGVAGIHFDYLRYPGNAYKFNNSVNAVNYFTKQASNAIHKINSKLIVSAAVMPEPSSMKKCYAQDIPTMSKYLDVIVPMVYKGNYHAGTSWIKSVTQQFVKKSNGAKIWTGIQTYKSDEDVTKLSSGALMKDADAAAMGGAYGVILFRFGLINYINFNNV